jgi:hypothetical protein
MGRPPAFDPVTAVVLWSAGVSLAPADPCGVAISATLRLLATMQRPDRRLQLFAIGDGGHLTPAGALGGWGTGPLQFGKRGGEGEDFKLAFTCVPGATPTLLVPEWGNSRVQEVDVVTRTHAGDLYPAGSLPRPRGVATSHAHIAVSNAAPGVALFHAGTRALLRAIAVGTPAARQAPQAWLKGLRLTADGRRVAVADFSNCCVHVHSVGDGSLVARVPAPRVYPHDVEEVEGGWLLASSSLGVCRVEGEAGDGAATPAGLPPVVTGVVDCVPAVTAMAMLPGVGLAITHRQAHSLQVRGGGGGARCV